MVQGAGLENGGRFGLVTVGGDGNTSAGPELCALKKYLGVIAAGVRVATSGGELVAAES